MNGSQVVLGYLAGRRNTGDLTCWKYKDWQFGTGRIKFAWQSVRVELKNLTDD
jgi:hypothetical protein